MAAYVIANVISIAFNADVAEYLRKIDATLEPFGGEFLVHGAHTPVRLEGDWKGDPIVIGFPDVESAQAWYDSSTYREILHLRLDHSVVDTIILGGVPSGYRADSVLKYLLPESA